MAGSYASGNWVVNAGSEDEFLSSWSEFLHWTRENAEGFKEAHLIRDQDEPRHFISFAEWESDEAQQGWRALPEFPEKLGACRALCEDFRGGAFSHVASV